MEGVALTLEDENYLPQVCRSTKDKVWKRIDDLLRARQDKSQVQNNWGDFFDNLHYRPGDNTQHTKSLIGIGRT